MVVLFLKILVNLALYETLKPRGFNKTDRCALAEWSILKYIRTENIIDTNILIKAVVVFVGKKIYLKVCGSKNKKESKIWWKRGIKK